MTLPLWIPWIDRGRCIGCGECIAHCPSHALMQFEGKAVVKSPQACTYCAVCENLCPVGAIELPYMIVKSPKPQELQNE